MPEGWLEFRRSRAQKLHWLDSGGHKTPFPLILSVEEAQVLTHIVDGCLFKYKGIGSAKFPEFFKSPTEISHRYRTADAPVRLACAPYQNGRRAEQTAGSNRRRSRSGCFEETHSLLAKRCAVLRSGPQKLPPLAVIASLGSLLRPSFRSHFDPQPTTRTTTRRRTILRTRRIRATS
jgi:hypothetical protein